MKFLASQEDIGESHFGNRRGVPRIGGAIEVSLGIHPHHLSKTNRLAAVRFHVATLYLQAVRRHHIVRGERAEILAFCHREQLVHRRHKSLVRTMHILEAEFFLQSFQNLRRTVRAAIVDDDEFKRDALLRHHGTHRRFYELFVIETCQQYGNERSKLTLFRFLPLSESLHIDILSHFFGKHVRYGVFHLSLRTTT